jgi:type IV pilus assembly protein PilV
MMTFNACRPDLRYPPDAKGGTLLEGLLAIVLFSVGLLAILRLLTVSTIDNGNAQYRSEASLLASDLISQIWTGDRSLQGITDRFGNTSTDDYRDWLASVQRRLPGVSAASHVPVITIGSDRTVTVSLSWKAPGDKDAHQLIFQALITD